jgi:hypothetical protein
VLLNSSGLVNYLMLDIGHYKKKGKDIAVTGRGGP